MSDEVALLDIREAGEFLKVSETSLRRWTNIGVLACLRVGRRRERRFRRADLVAFMEHQPLSLTRAAPREAAVSMGRSVEEPFAPTHGSHLCALYASELGRVTIAVRFLLDGLLEGSMVYLVASPRSSRHILGHLKERRPSLQRDISAGKLLVSVYQKSPAAQIKEFASHLDKAVAAGTQSFRIFGDVWELRRNSSAQSVVEYEARYDQFIARRYPVVTICAYDVRHFSGVDVLDTLKSHRDTFRYPLERALA